ncbi:MAG TPA: ABC transporter ATP-binding protein [Streptosporangiaceae bacterium]|nr:ABC transporter ATP-binding protein [Streptosporangiaceae bacterium]
MAEPAATASPAVAARSGPRPGPMVEASDLVRTFGRGEAAVPALRGVSFTVQPGELVVVYGRSGSGKTTLLNIVGGLDPPTSGTVRVAGQDVTRMTERQRTVLRRDTVAFIFQSFGLIPILSAAENVGLPLRITATDRRAREERVRLLLSVVGLADHARQRPDELSGGQQQRVAIARALAGSPELLIADEPTGQLDSETGRQVVRLIQTIVRSEGITALVATHDAELVNLADHVLRLEDGRLLG